MKNIRVDLDVRDRGSRQLNRFSKEAQTSFRRVERSAEKSTGVMNRQFNRLSNSLKGFISKIKLMVPLLGIAAAGAVVHFTKKSIEMADSIAKTADSIGVSTSKLQEFRYIAQRSGMEVSQLDTSLQTFSRRLGEMRSGTGSLNSALENLDKNLKEQLLTAKNLDEALNIYFNALKDVEDQSDRTALAAAAFGSRSGAAMSLMVDNIEVLRERFRRLGLEIDENLLRQAEKAKDNIDDLSAVLRVSFQTILLHLSPILGEIANNTALWVAENDELIKQGIPELIGEIAEAARNATEWLQKMGSTIKWLSVLRLHPTSAYWRIMKEMDEFFGKKDEPSEHAPTIDRPTFKPPKSPIKQTTEAIEEQQEVLKDTRHIIASINDEWDKYMLPEKMYEELQVWKWYENTLKELGGKTTETLENLLELKLALVEASHLQVEADSWMLREQKQLTDEQIEAFKELNKEIEDTTKQVVMNFELIGDSILSNFTNHMVDMITLTRNWKESFSDMARSIGRDIMRMAMEFMFLASIKKMFGGTFFGGMFGFKDGGITPEIPGASGGAVFSGPKSGYLAELHGNEAVIPLKNGAVPVTLSGQGSGGGNNITINVPVQIEGGGMDERDASKFGEGIARIIENKIKKVLFDERRVGGIITQRSY